MATDGSRYFWNREFVDSMTLEETIFVCCHEILHVVWEHVDRFKERNYNHQLANIAADFVINETLIDDRVGTMPKVGLRNTALVHEAKYSMDEVYRLLPKHYPPKGGAGRGSGSGDGPGVGSIGKPLDDVLPRKGSPAEQATARALAKVQIAQAAAAAKMCGHLSAGLQRIVSEILRPKVDWRTVLRNFINVRVKSEYTWARPKRRFAGEDLYLPSLGGIGMGDLVVAVDCSGSIGEKELAEFSAEIKAICEDVRPATLHVVYFDSEVCHYDTFERGAEVTIAAHGGGGTAFSPIFKHIDQNSIDPACCVVLTDLCCSDFGPPPAYPVLWCSTHDGKAPWGQVTMMR